MTASLAWYAYAVLPDGAPPPPVQAILPEASFELVAAAGMAALASPVPRGLFDRDAAANRTGDPDWIGDRARAHHAVAAAAAAGGACLPLAFGALFASRDSLGAWLHARAAPLGEALARLAGRSEWMLRLHEDAEAHAAWLDRHDPALQALAARIAITSPGTAFLLERRLAQARATARAARTDVAQHDVAAVLADHPGLVEQKPACWTVLADAAGRQALEAALAPLAAGWEGSGLTLALSGPWPPYAYARGVLADA